MIHSIDLYDKTKTHSDGTVYTKIDRVCDMAATLPLPPHSGYVLLDSWFTCPRVIDSYAVAGYHLIGGLKTNRILYPQDLKSNAPSVIAQQSVASRYTSAPDIPILLCGVTIFP